jgi:predicted Zn-dependent protease
MLSARWTHAVAALALAATGLMGGAALAADVSKSEVKRAKELHVQITQQMGVYNDTAVQEYVSRIGQKMASVSDMPGIEWYFTVLDTDDINAFTTGGGYVYVSRGLLAYLDSEAELAAVLGHEIGHVTGKHPSRQQTQGTLAGIASAAAAILTGQPALGDLTNIAGTAIVRGYGRDMELEADRIGAQYLARAGYDPEAMIRVVATLKDQDSFEREQARKENREPRVYHGVFATHPDNDSRLKEAISSAGKASVTAKGNADNRNDYLKAIDGLAFGSSSRQGMVRDNRFYHADYQFTVAFPRGWTVRNSSDELAAASPGKDSLIVLNAQAPPGDVKTPRDFLNRALGRMPLADGRELTINGLPAYTLIARGHPSPFGGNTNVRYVAIYYNNLMWIFRGASRGTNTAPSADPMFLSAAQTFRRLRDTEFALAEPMRIRIVTAEAGTSIEELARTSPIPKFPEQQLRLINDLYPNKQPREGEPLKVVR